MKVSHAEQHAIATVIAYGHRFGYGNLICHLRTAWARSLMDKYGMDEATARMGAHGGGHMPFLMQDDIVMQGFWDETGERYRNRIADESPAP